MSKTVLVTGGAGYIGSSLVDSLIEKKYRVIVVDDFNDYYDPRIKHQNLNQSKEKLVKLIEADIRQNNLFERVFAEYPVDCVVHLAARAGVRPSLLDPQLYWSVNVMGSLNLLEAMRKKKVGQLVVASSSSVYGNRKSGPFVETDNTDLQISPYGASKKALEVLCGTYAKLYGIKTSVLRFFTVFGPRNRPDMACYKFVDAVKKGQPITQYGDGSTGRDYTYIDDIVDGIFKAIEKPFEYQVFNLGNSKPVLLRDLIKTVEKVVGKKAVIDIQPRQSGDVDLTYADNSKAKKMLGWEPKTGLEEGLGRLVEWKQTRK